MRIVGGALRGRRLPGTPAKGTRPTSDRVREAIASALQARGLLQGAQVLDLYAGTGALGLEALSWGAERVLAVDSCASALRCIRDNVRALGVEDRVKTLKLELASGAKPRLTSLGTGASQPFTLVFADPPYAQAAVLPGLLGALVERGLLSAEAYVVVEHARDGEPATPAGFDRVAAYRYGDTGVLLWRLA